MPATPRPAPRRVPALALAAALAVPLLASAEPTTLPAEAARAVAAADVAGARVDVGALDLTAIPELEPVIAPDGGPRLVLSDKPEYFRTGDGVALREDLDPGPHRLYLYHVPTPDAGPKQITAVIENRGDGPMRVAFDRAVLPDPGGDYHAIGKAGQVGLLTPDDPDAADLDFTLEPGAARTLDPRLGGFELVTNDLIHGIYDFTVDQPARLSVLQAEPGADPAEAARSLPALPQVLPGHHPSGAGRGTFPDPDRTLTIAAPYDTADGPRQVIFADGDDDWMRGSDDLAAGDPGLGEPEPLNKGNYGAVYRVRLPYTSGDGRGVALAVYNPRAEAQWCGFQAVAVRVLGENATLPMAGSGVVELPADGVRYGGPPEAVVVQHFPPAPDGEEGVIELLFTPPGASCLPVPLVLLPVGGSGGEAGIVGGPDREREGQ